jgi:quercetin dioxygenase-like cupin family protein
MYPNQATIAIAPGGVSMTEFPAFMKKELNRVPSSAQNTNDVEGYYYEAADGSQAAFWTCRSAQTSKKHRHDFDEYTVVVAGQYIAYVEGERRVLNPGDEFFVPRGKEQWGECIAGTRTIHFFGGRRIV